MHDERLGSFILWESGEKSGLSGANSGLSGPKSWLSGPRATCLGCPGHMSGLSANETVSWGGALGWGDCEKTGVSKQGVSTSRCESEKRKIQRLF